MRKFPWLAANLYRARIFRRAPAFALICVLYSMDIAAVEYFVSPAGSDSHAGTRRLPFATLQKASTVLRPGDTCYLREGVYREVLRPERSGEPGAAITFANWQDEQAEIVGADVLAGWRAEGDGVYSAPMSWSLDDENQFFANGEMLIEASWPAPGDAPLFNLNRAVASGGSPTTLVCAEIPGSTDAWKGARLWCAGGDAWICWTSEVTAYDADSHTLTFKEARDRWYTPRQGSKFVLRGLRRALHAPGQWFHDTSGGRVLIVPPEGTDIETLVVEAKRRVDAIDLSDRSHIRIRGIGFRAAGIRTNAASSHIVLENLHGRYVAHANGKEIGDASGVLLHGANILLLSCDLGYSSSSVVSVQGSDNRVINCSIHHGGYGGLWRGAVRLSGRRIVFSHNTVRHAGRDLVSTHGLMESLVQYNDVSEAGWLTKDLALFYGHNTDFANTEFRYNWVHDNHAEHCAMGIYFDHLSHNAIVHHNVIWNVGMDPTRFNNPSYGNLVFNNTCAKTGGVSTFDHSRRNDLFASRFFNNIYNQAIKLPDHVAVVGNHIIAEPEFRDPDNHDFRLKESVGEEIGAYAPDGVAWRAGCDLENPPDPLPVREAPRMEWMNTVRNACFEFGSVEGWTETDGQNARLVKGNGWGNAIVGGSDPPTATGTSRYELRLGPGRDGVAQVITGLTPGVAYTLSVWTRVSDAGERIDLEVMGHGNPEVSVWSSSTEWTRQSLDFTTGAEAMEATIRLRKTTTGDGYAWGDNVTLPLRLTPVAR